MSQVFSADSVYVGAGGSYTQTGESVVLTGNFLNPPFQNAKAIVLCTVAFTAAAAMTTMLVRVRRNPNAENSSVGASQPLTVTAGNVVIFGFNTADVIPDGRPVQYALTLTPTGASGPGTIQSASVSAILISG